MSWGQIFFSCVALLIAVGGLIMAHARTRPKEAASALSEWAEFYGFHTIPTWLRNEKVDAIAQRWAGIVILVSLITGIFGWSVWYFERSRTTETPSVANSPSQPPADATPPTPGKSELSPPIYGLLQPWQSTIFINTLAEMKGELSSQILIARPHMLEPQIFSRLFENAAIRAGITPIVVEQNPTGPDQTGVMIAVPDTNAPSSIALKIRSLIRQLGFEGRFVPLLASPPPSQSKEVENFAIFIGPSPL